MNQNQIKRFFVMLIGTVFLALGIAIFKISLMGNDPYSAMVMAMSEAFSMEYAFFLLLINFVWFIAQIIFGRKYIGAGTFVNWVCIGFITTFFVNLFHRLFTVPDIFICKFIIMFIGVVVTSLGISLYQTSDTGISPYDSLSVILSDKTPVPYFWCRIFTDSVCAIVTFIFGGLLGLGTLSCALAVGPFVSFFDRHISQKLCKE